MTDDRLSLDALALGLRLSREAEGAGPIVVLSAEVPALRYLLEHYRGLIEADNKRRADLRRAQRQAGRKRAENPAPSTLRSRATRARQRAAKDGEPEK